MPMKPRRRCSKAIRTSRSFLAKPSKQCRFFPFLARKHAPRYSRKELSRTLQGVERLVAYRRRTRTRPARTINAVLAGTVATEVLVDLSPEARRRMKSLIPLKRLASVDDILGRDLFRIR